MATTLSYAVLRPLNSFVLPGNNIVITGGQTPNTPVTVSATNNASLTGIDFVTSTTTIDPDGNPDVTLGLQDVNTMFLAGTGITITGGATPGTPISISVTR